MERSFGSVVFDRRPDGIRYLLVQHARGGHWDFPKGHPLPGETRECTVMREILEETGFEVRIIPRFEEEICYLLPDDKPKKVVLYLSRAVKKAVDPHKDEISRLEWFHFHEASDRLTHENSRAVLFKADEFLSKLKNP